MFSQDIDVTVEKAPNNDKGGLDSSLGSVAY